MSDTTTTTPPTPSDAPSDKAAFWRQAVHDHAASGLSVRDYGRRHGLHETRFFTWRRDLGRSPVPRPEPGTRPTPPPAAGFVPVRVVPDTTAEVTRPGGVVVRVPVPADPAAVARRVAALAGGRP